MSGQTDITISGGKMATTVGSSAELFTRRATGLVRAVPQRSALVFNFIPVAAVIFYYVARAIRRSKGVKLELAYAEIPPE